MCPLPRSAGLKRPGDLWDLSELGTRPPRSPLSPCPACSPCFLSGRRSSGSGHPGSIRPLLGVSRCGECSQLRVEPPSITSAWLCLGLGSRAEALRRSRPARALLGYPPGGRPPPLSTIHRRSQPGGFRGCPLQAVLSSSLAYLLPALLARGQREGTVPMHVPSVLRCTGLTCSGAGNRKQIWLVPHQGCPGGQA